MHFKLFNADNISELHVKGVDHLIAQYIASGCQPFIANVDTKMSLLQYQGMTLPFSINNKEYESSYVCSPYNAFVSYGRDTLLASIPRVLRTPLKALINGLASPLKWMRINRCVQVNNRLWSTNLYPEQSDLPIHDMRQYFTKAYPKHALAFRSLTQSLNQTLITKLTSDGFILVPSRPVCMIDYRTPQPMSKKSSKNDRRHLNKTQFVLIEVEDIQYADELFTLYHKMFIQQHSKHNAQLTPLFFKTCIEQKAINIKALQNPQTGKLVAMLGLFIEGNVLTVPFSGYDTHLDKSFMLYPILNAIIAKECTDKALCCHASAGAMPFKKSRGGIEEMEYTAIYVKHLPWFRQYGWKILSKLSGAFFKEHTQ
ncbi:hypothetical protein [uncultured Shewanella sp.]|uniref:hypothetical protein n=1 Tax=uncultured Shewanella sp. TaxID=173975 RepID=UPI002609F6C2|nr:hypothetical protein [uncultured Shewanella sp.]